MKRLKFTIIFIVSLCAFIYAIVELSWTENTWLKGLFIIIAGIGGTFAIITFTYLLEDNL